MRPLRPAPLTATHHRHAVPGTRDEGRLDENWDASKVELSSAELAELQHVVDNAAIAGDRYPEAMMKGCVRAVSLEHCSAETLA